MEGKCTKHNVDLEDTDCSRCGGNGYTESDIDDFHNPIEWHSGDCYVCKGSGILKKWVCHLCEEEFQEEEMQ